MTREEHLERLNQSVEEWNRWRKENPRVKPDLRGANLREANLNGVHLYGIMLNGADLSGADLRQADLNGAFLRGTILSGADLSGAILRDAFLQGAKLCGAKLCGVKLSNTNLSGFDLSNVDLSDADLSDADLGNANLNGANLCGSDLRRANLSHANLCEANLYRANLNGLDLRGVNLNGANLYEVNLGGADLRGANCHKSDLRGATLHAADICGANLSEADLRGIDLIGSFLNGADLREADLREAYLHDANLSEADLSGADLSGADLCRAQFLGTSLERAKFTAACLEDWNINSDTNFDGVICEYVYLKAFKDANEDIKRRPREGTYKPGEFAALYQQAVDTVDLIFKDGIDWQAFFQSFQDLRSQYADDNLSIQGIERKQGEAFVIRLAMSPKSDKTAIESSAKELYTTEIKAIESQYEERLRLQGQHLEDARQTIEIERRDKATLMGVMTTLATSQQGPKYVFNQPQFGGGFAETVQGSQYGSTLNNASTKHSSPLPSLPSLTKATAEIQNLLTPLKTSNPAATQADQIAFLNLMILPPQRERFISALQSTHTTNTALETLPYGPLLKALVKSWQSPGSEE